MRADRLLAVLMLLQRLGRMTAGELARRLEVSERTIYRDLEALAAAGVPVYSEPGRGGGVRLLEPYRTDLTGLSLGEAEVLPLLGLGDALAGLGLGPSLAQTEAKVLAALPRAQRERAEQLRRRVHVDLSAWWHGAEVVPHLSTLVEAAFTHRRLRARYRRGDRRTVRRTLDPLGLVLKAGVWYLVAGAGSQAARTYRASRILEAQLLDEHFEPHPDFELASFWKARRDEFQTAGTAYEVVVRARPGAVQALRNDYESEAPSAEWTTMELTFGSHDHALRRLLTFGSSVEVVEPAELRAAVSSAVRETAALYEP